MIQSAGVSGTLLAATGAAAAGFTSGPLLPQPASASAASSNTLAHKKRRMGKVRWRDMVANSTWHVLGSRRFHYITVMDWTKLLLWPATMLLIVAALCLLLSLAQGVAVVRRVRRRRHVAAVWHGFWLVVFVILTLSLAGAGVALRGYHALTRETRVAQLTAQAEGPQLWRVRLALPGEAPRVVSLRGDAFRLEARVVKWTLPALLSGAPPVYRLDRLSGRYDDPTQAAEAAPSVVPLAASAWLDLWSLKHHYPRWLPGVDAVYGSGAYLPLVDGGHYRVTLAPGGGLVARPADAATAAALD